jgi:hypothetical protein
MAAPDLRKHVHAHGCKRCHVRYRDACQVPAVNALCFTCRTGKAGFRELLAGQAPRDCCHAHSRLVQASDKSTYYLAGDATWFICAVCKRTFPYEVPTPKEIS